MSFLSRLKPSFGFLDAGADAAQVARGARRTVAILAFTTFCLVVAAATDNEWVSGGLEYVVSATNPAAINAVCGGCLGTSEPALGATVNVQFELGLSQFSQDTAYQMPYTNEYVERDCVLPIQPFIRYINAAAVSNDTSPRNIWKGLQPIPDKFGSTLGLLGFASFLQIVAWLLVVAVQYEVPALSANQKTLWAIRILAATATLFTLSGIINFAASAVRREFCTAFDPDADFLGLPCGFGRAFNIAIAALVFGLLQTAAAWKHMPLELPASYQFATQQKVAATGFGGSASAYEPVGDTRSEGLAPGAYQS